VVRAAAADAAKVTEAAQRGGQHDREAEDAQDDGQRGSLVEHDPDDEHREPEDEQHHVAADPAHQVGARVRGADRAREFRVVLDKSALDLLEQALLVFRERH
jgi:hypothetical protein